MRHNRRRSLVVVAAVVLVTVATVTGATAYWRGAGIGTGTASTGTAQPVTLSPGTAAAQLYPGGQAAVSLTISNPGPASVRVESLGLDTGQGSGGFAVDAGHSTCNLSVLSVTAQTNGGAGWAVPGGGSSAVTLPNAISMSMSALSACQGASLTVYLRAGS